MQTIKFTEDAIVKAAPVHPSDLEMAHKYYVAAGEMFPLTGSERVRNHHLKINFFPSQYLSLNVAHPYYVEASKVEIFDAGHQRILPPNVPPVVPAAAVPYRSALAECRPDDDRSWDAAADCALAACNGVLQYFGKPTISATDCPLKGGDLVVTRLPEFFSHYSISGHSTRDATLDDLRLLLSEGRIAIVPGWFARQEHMITVLGYDADGFIAHDPRGARVQTGFYENYETSHEKGAFQHFSTNLIKKAAMPDGYLWLWASPPYTGES